MTEGDPGCQSGAITVQAEINRFSAEDAERADWFSAYTQRGRCMRNTKWLLGMAVLIAGCVPASGVTILEDVVYGHKAGMALTFDVYQPATSNGAGVVILNSGGWISPFYMLHTEDSGAFQLLDYSEPKQVSAKLLTDRGFTVFNLRHSSVPKFSLPEVVTDVRIGLREILKRAPEFDVERDRLGLWGASAGGHLSLLLATSPEIGPDEEHSEEPVSGVSAVVAYFPVTELESERIAATNHVRETYGLELLDMLPGFDYHSDLDEELSPITYATADDPPTLFIHGDQDRLAPLRQSEIMLESLSEAGATAELFVLEGAGHGFAGNDLDAALNRTLDWFELHLVR